MDKNEQNFLYYMTISVTRAGTCQFAYNDQIVTYHGILKNQVSLF